MELVYFFSIVLVAVLSAVAVLLSKNTVHSALFLVVNLFCIALLYLSLTAEFLALVQITVYAGAIMVLFLFVITMLNPSSEETPNKLVSRLPVAVGLSMAFLVGLGVMALSSLGYTTSSAGVAQPATGNGNIEAIGASLFTQYLLPFELVSLLLLVAMVAAMVLAKRRA
jgi:NADH-quinone oxidoreductase subunit J